MGCKIVLIGFTFCATAVAVANRITKPARISTIHLWVYKAAGARVVSAAHAD